MTNSESPDQKEVLTALEAIAEQKESYKEDKDVTGAIITELDKYGLKAYDNEPPMDSESPWILILDKNSKQFNKAANDVTKIVVIRIVKLRELGIKELKQESERILNLLHGKNLPIGVDDNIYCHNLSVNGYNIDKWNVVDQVYSIVKSDKEVIKGILPAVVVRCSTCGAVFKTINYTTKCYGEMKTSCINCGEKIHIDHDNFSSTKDYVKAKKNTYLLRVIKYGAVMFTLVLFTLIVSSFFR